jgi:hypothetical protein
MSQAAAEEAHWHAAQQRPEVEYEARQRAWLGYPVQLKDLVSLSGWMSRRIRLGKDKISRTGAAHPSVRIRSPGSTLNWIPPRWSTLQLEYPIDHSLDVSLEQPTFNEMELGSWGEQPSFPGRGKTKTQLAGARATPWMFVPCLCKNLLASDCRKKLHLNII